MFTPKKTMKQYDRRVTFADENNLVTVHPIYAWTHAYQQSRKSEWVQMANNRARFQNRIDKSAAIIEPVLKQKLESMSGKN